MAARSRIKGKGKSLYRCFKGTVSIFCGLGGWTLQLPARCKYRNHLHEGCVHSWGNNWVISSISVEQDKGLSKEFGSRLQPQFSLALCWWGKAWRMLFWGLNLSLPFQHSQKWLEEALERESQALSKKPQGVTHTHTYSWSATGWKAHDKKNKWKPQSCREQISALHRHGSRSLSLITGPQCHQQHKECWYPR